MWIRLDDRQMTLIETSLAFRISDVRRQVDNIARGPKPALNKDLIERLSAKQRELQATLDRFGKARADFDPADPYRAAAKEQEHVEGECEIDDGAIVSHGEDPGAYVMAWIWITDEQAGRFTCEECSGSIMAGEMKWSRRR